jgi:beta-N-acetylhexosaminidase
MRDTWHGRRLRSGARDGGARKRRRAAQLVTLLLTLATALYGCASSSGAAKPTATATYSPTATATATPYGYKFHENPFLATPNAPMTFDQVAQKYLANMTMNQKLGQLILVALEGTTLNSDNLTMIRNQAAGGILLYTDNMTSVAQTKALIASAQAHAAYPLLVLTDEEGGYVDRLTQFYGYRSSATEIGDKGSKSYAQGQGVQTGKDMSVLGFNADFAPDVDVQLVDGPDQRTRTFGSTPDAVTAMAGAYLTGMQSQNVAVCLKHFPGLGAATSDAHLGLPVIDRTVDQINAVELEPYKALIATGQVGMIMSTDLLMKALDPTLPAEISPAIINGVLRTQLGYNGVVVTDALYMEGISKKYDAPTAAAMAIEAGDDLLVGPFTPSAVSAYIGGIKEAMANGQISTARINQSVLRIIKLKMRMGVLPVPAHYFDMSTAPKPLGSMTVREVGGPFSWKARS